MLPTFFQDMFEICDKLVSICNNNGNVKGKLYFLKPQKIFVPQTFS